MKQQGLVSTNAPTNQHEQRLLVSQPPATCQLRRSGRAGTDSTHTTEMMYS